LLDHIEEVMHNGGEPLFESGEKFGILERIFSGRNVRIVALLWFIVVTMLLLPMAAILDAPEEVLGILGLMGPVGALMVLVLSFFMPNAQAKAKSKERRKEARNAVTAEPRELPPDRTSYVSDFVPPAERSEDDAQFAGRRPHSVTEDTTRHLKRNDED